MKNLALLSAALLLGACTYHNEPERYRSTDELVRENEAVAAPDTDMYVDAPRDRTPVILYHTPGYYQSNPQRYYSDPYSVYNDPHSSLYHRNYGYDGYPRAQAQATAEAKQYGTTRPAPARFVPATTPPMGRPAAASAPRTYRYTPTPRVSTPIAPAPAKFSTATPARTYTMPRASTPAPAPRTFSAPTRTYTAPRTYSAPVRSTPAPSYHSTPASHPSISVHH